MERGVHGGGDANWEDALAGHSERDGGYVQYFEGNESPNRRVSRRCRPRRAEQIISP